MVFFLHRWQTLTFWLVVHTYAKGRKHFGHIWPLIWSGLVIIFRTVVQYCVAFSCYAIIWAAHRFGFMPVTMRRLFVCYIYLVMFPLFLAFNSLYMNSLLQFRHKWVAWMNNIAKCWHLEVYFSTISRTLRNLWRHHRLSFIGDGLRLVIQCVYYTLCSEKNTHSHFLSYLNEWCVDLNKNCTEYT